MKMHLTLILLLIVIIICSCEQTTKIVQSGSDTTLVANSSSIYEFTSHGELFRFIDENMELRQRIAENYPTDIRNKLNPENRISVQTFVKLPFTMVLAKITYSGNFINYVYYLDGFKPVEVSSLNSENGELSDNKEPILNEHAAKVQEELKEKTIYEYYNEHGLSEYEINEIETLNNSISLSWGFTKNGRSGLENFAGENSPVVRMFSEDIYISDANNFYEKEPFGKTIYWTQDDYFFYASVPGRYVDEFIGLLTDNKELVSFISYESKTKMKILH